MLFNSFHFLFFFIVFLPLYFLTSGRLRKVLTLFASYYFYMCWSRKYITLIWAITLVDFVTGILIEQARAISLRRLYLFVSLGSNILLLIVFKYFNFMSLSVSRALHHSGFAVNDPPLLLSVILPIGLSFHTFQAMSYTIEVYKGRSPAERSFLHYALYVAFFPQMVAGPIERPNHLLPQFHIEHRFSWPDVAYGARQTLWGLFKKMILADGVASFVNMAYARPEQFDGTVLLVATLMFALQIYCDFSGYSDMAIGLGRIMGFHLTTNFRRPYFARSVGEFWHRWHISLSTWFRDYVYIPLGGNRVAVPRFYLNILITFVASGLWHGANWTFIIWGFLHGLYLLLSHWTAPVRRQLREILRMEKFPKALASFQVMLTLVLVCFAWVFFRASSLRDALFISRHIFTFGHFDTHLFLAGGIQQADLPVFLFLVLSMIVVEWLIEHPEHRPALWSKRSVRYALYYACIFAVIFYGTFGHVDFIYFKF